VRNNLATKSFPLIKPEIRVLGVDDGKFVPHTNAQVLVVGIVFRGGYWLDGLLQTRIAVDGFDATYKIASMITSSIHCRQLQVIMLNGITFAGFNVVDIKALNVATGLPVITVTREKPDLTKIHNALKNLPESERRWKMIREAGEPSELATRSMEAKLYVQTAGIRRDDAEKIVRFTSTRSYIPEPLRVAHIVASGLGPIYV
jgi:uncharacterized protein